MKESKIMLLQYITGTCILVLGATHFGLLTLASGGLQASLEFSKVESTYLAYGLVFELLLTFLSFHVFNGFRRILLEFRQGKTYDSAVTWLMFLGGAATFVWGTRTVLILMEVIH